MTERDQRAQSAAHEMQNRGTKPGAAEGKGAQGAQVGPPLSPTGPNETEHGVIRPRFLDGPGLNGLAGGPGYSGLSSAGPSADEANRAGAKERDKQAAEGLKAAQDAQKEHEDKVKKAQEAETKAREKWEKEALEDGGDFDEQAEKAQAMAKKEQEANAKAANA